RWRDGRQPHGTAGAADVAGATETDGHGGEVSDLPDLYQPDSREDWRDVRESGDDDRRKGAEVLFVGENRYPAHRGGEGRRRGDWIGYQSQDREKQGGAAVPRCGV